MQQSTPYGVRDTSYKAAGEYPGLVKLVERFYGYMDSLPEAAVIRAMHPSDLTQSKDKLVCFLSGWLGGPRLYTQKYGSIHIPRAHQQLPVDEAARDAWLLCMERALAEQDYAAEFKAYMLQALFVPAERIRATSQKANSV